MKKRILSGPPSVRSPGLQPMMPIGITRPCSEQPKKKISTEKKCSPSSYLNWCRQNEFLKCIADCVLDKISKQVRDTKRWDILKQFVDITLKPLRDKRWEAKLDSVKALRYQLGGALNALENLEPESKNGQISVEACALSNEIQTMEFMTCLVIWNEMLSFSYHAYHSVLCREVIQ